jgi:hypothetical protein
MFLNFEHHTLMTYYEYVEKMVGMTNQTYNNNKADKLGVNRYRRYVLP